MRPKAKKRCNATGEDLSQILSQIPSQIRSCYVVALASEAAPLLESERWQQIMTHPFRIYQTENRALIISGIGRMSAAAATAYLGSLLSQRNAVWINFGTAGHSAAPVGSGFLAHKIIDTHNRKNYYPLRLAYQRTSVLCCRDLPQSSYPPDALVDMESVGFFTTAGLFTYHELIYLYKIVSDNPGYPFQKTQVASLIKSNLVKIKEITALAENMAERHLQAKNNLEATIAEWLEQASNIWRLSFTNRHKLAEIFRRWFILRSRSDAYQDASPFVLLNQQDRARISGFANFIAALEGELRQICLDEPS